MRSYPAVHRVSQDSRGRIYSLQKKRRYGHALGPDPSQKSRPAENYTHRNPPPVEHQSTIKVTGMNVDRSLLDHNSPVQKIPNAVTPEQQRQSTESTLLMSRYYTFDKMKRTAITLLTLDSFFASR